MADETREVIEIDLDSFTVNEMVDVEDATDLPFHEAARALLTPDLRRAMHVRAFLWVLKRRDQPDFTLDDAGNLRPVDYSMRLAESDEPEDPTSAPGDEVPDG